MDQIDQIRQKIDIIELINSYMPVKKAGRNFKASCPFHSEKTPSFVISPERQIWKCFGCDLGGDVYRFLMEYEKMTFGEALRFLADKAGIKLTSFQPSPQQQEKEKLLSINHLASEFYHYILLNHQAGKKGLNYLLGRGISKTSIKQFKLGYAPDAWETLINFLVKKKKYSFTDLEKTGLAIKGTSSFYDRFRGRIIFPLSDHRNNILGFSGRVLQQDFKGAKYINSPETMLYHKGDMFYGLYQAKDHIKKSDKTVIVEGEFDVISSFQAGVKNVVATKGSALTENQVNLIKRFAPKIILALDADTAGDAAVKRGIDIADKAGLVVRVVQVRHGKDPDECARHSASMWRESVKKSIPVYDFYLNSAYKKYDQNSPEGKKSISEELVPHFSKITNEVVKAHYIKKLALLLKVDEEAIIKEFVRQEKKEKKPVLPTYKTFVKAKTVKAKTRKENIEEFLLSLLLQNEKSTSEFIEFVQVDYFSHPAVKKILLALKKFLLKKDKFEVNLFAHSLPAELVATLDKLFLVDLGKILENDSLFKREFTKVNEEIKNMYLKEKLSLLTQKIREKEKVKDDKSLQVLKKKFANLSKELKDLR
ncbi:DNA primase [Patescibacteria group bacterium]